MGLQKRRLLMVTYYLMTMLLTGRAQQCRKSKRTAWCHDRGLYKIPFEIRNDTLKLMLQDNDIINSKENDAILTRLVVLTYINFSNNNLSALPNALPASLEQVLLSKNNIKYVGQNPLEDLVNLEKLDLNDNALYDTGFHRAAFIGTTRLRTLLLSRNRLRSVPEGLPSSLRVLTLSDNDIERISAASLNHLVNLEELMLDSNKITNSYIEPSAFSQLVSLNLLELRKNKLFDVPADIPATLQQLHLANNKIRFLYGDDAYNHGGIRRLANLKSLDVSYNEMESIEPDAFTALQRENAIQLHDNPWRCDCYLRYLKEWLKAEKAALSRQEQMLCYEPEEFGEVTLNNIELEALQCKSRTKTNQYMSLTGVSGDRAFIRWKYPFPDPGYVSRKIMYGLVDCFNCTDKDLQNRDASAQDFLSDVNFMPVRMGSKDKDINVTIKNLQPATRYAICMMDSLQPSEYVPAKQCLIATTTNNIIGDKEEMNGRNEMTTTWIIIVILVCLLVVIAGFGVSYYMCRRNNGGSLTQRSRSRRHKKPRDNGQQYYPGTVAAVQDTDPYSVGTIGGATTYQPAQQGGGTGLPIGHHQQQPRHLPQHFYDRGQSNYETQGSDRTYAECGSYRSSMAPNPSYHRMAQATAGPPIANSSFHRLQQHRDSGVDARKEFDIMTSSGLPKASSAIRHMVSPFQESLTSSDGPDTMSTYQTGTIGSRDTNVDDNESNYLLPHNPGPPLPMPMMGQPPPPPTTQPPTNGSMVQPYDHLIPHHTGTPAMMMMSSRHRDYGNLLPAAATPVSMTTPTTTSHNNNTNNNNNSNNEMYI